MRAYDQQTVDNPSWLKRLSHRRRFQIAAELLAPAGGDCVLDYGTGDGYLLSVLAAARPGASYFGYEPVVEMRAQALALWQRRATPAHLLSSRDELDGLAVDRISCLEVLEHLDEPRLQAAFADFRRLLKPDGLLLVSVPVEIGLTALAKNAVRIIAGQAQEGSRPGPLVNAALGRTQAISRVSRGGYIDSHIGFDHRKLRDRLQQEGFLIEHEQFAPLAPLRGLLNSQVFWRCRRRT